MRIWKNNKQEYIELELISTVIECNALDYLKDNPTLWLFDGEKRFACNILGNITEIKNSRDVRNFIVDKEVCLTKEWAILKPVNFTEAVRAWDCGSTILCKSNDLIQPRIYTNDRGHRDDITFDGIDVLVYQWFVFKNKR